MRLVAMYLHILVFLPVNTQRIDFVLYSLINSNDVQYNWGESGICLFVF